MAEKLLLQLRRLLLSFQIMSRIPINIALPCGGAAIEAHTPATALHAGDTALVSHRGMGSLAPAVNTPCQTCVTVASSLTAGNPPAGVCCRFGGVPDPYPDSSPPRAGLRL